MTQLLKNSTPKSKKLSGWSSSTVSFHHQKSPNHEFCNVGSIPLAYAWTDAQRTLPPLHFLVVYDACEFIHTKEKLVSHASNLAIISYSFLVPLHASIHHLLYCAYIDRICPPISLCFSPSFSMEKCIEIHFHLV